MRRNNLTGECIVTVLLCVATACSSEAPMSAPTGFASTGTGGAPPMEDLFVTRVPASSVPVVVQKPPPATPPATMTSTPPATNTAPPTTPPAGGIPGAGGVPNVPPAAGGAPGAPATPPPAENTIPKATGGEPTLPEIMGECPEFRDGTTIMVAGHGSIQIRAGAPGNGGPILFYWHGTGSSAAESFMFPGNGEITAAGGIVAAFNGSQQASGGGDCSGTGAHNMADFNAADQIVACGVKNHGADSRRIYSTGCSAGGLQTGCMAMVRSSYLAAVAPNSGGSVFPQPWQSEHTPAVMTMHGAAGRDVVVVDFSNTSASFDMAAKSHGGYVVNCDHGGGHCMAPGNLQQAAWQFMKDHPWNTPSPWMANGIPAGTPEYCKVF
jgi:predicted esterase